MQIDWQPLWIVLVAFLRSFLGWAKVSFKDGVIQDFEIKKLGETIARVGLLGLVVAYFPWFDVTWLEAGAVALFGDLFLNAWKKRRTATS